MRTIGLIEKLATECQVPNAFLADPVNWTHQLLKAQEPEDLPAAQVYSRINDLFFTVYQAAYFFKVHPSTVRRWALKGYLKRYRFGCHISLYRGYDMVSFNQYRFKSAA